MESHIHRSFNLFVLSWAGLLQLLVYHTHTHKNTNIALVRENSPSLARCIYETIIFFVLYSGLDGWFHKPAVILRLNVGSQEILGPVYDYCLTVFFFILFEWSVCVSVFFSLLQYLQSLISAHIHRAVQPVHILNVFILFLNLKLSCTFLYYLQTTSEQHTNVT